MTYHVKIVINPQFICISNWAIVVESNEALLSRLKHKIPSFKNISAQSPKLTNNNNNVKVLFAEQLLKHPAKFFANLIHCFRIEKVRT